MNDSSGDSCSLGSGLKILTNGVSLSLGTKFYYLWSQPMNLFKMLGSSWSFVGVYVKFDVIKILFSRKGDAIYNDALSYI